MDPTSTAGLDVLGLTLVPDANSDRHWTSLVIQVNGRAFTQVVTEFTAENHFDVAGGYDWLAIDPGPGGRGPAKRRGP